MLLVFRTAEMQGGPCRSRIPKFWPQWPFSRSFAEIGWRDNVQLICDLLVLAIHLLVTFAKLLGPGCVRAVADHHHVLVLIHGDIAVGTLRHAAPFPIRLARDAEILEPCPRGDDDLARAEGGDLQTALAGAWAAVRPLTPSLITSTS